MSDVLEAPTSPPVVSLPVGWDADKLLELARELAMNINDASTIIANHGLDQPTYNAAVAENPFFKRAFEAFRLEWESATNTNKRLGIKAATALELALPVLTARISSKEESLDAAIKGAQLLAKMSGFDDKAKTDGGADKFTITINLGADEKLQFEKDITPKASQESAAETVRALIEGSLNEPALPSLTKGPTDAPAVRPISKTG